MTKAQIQNLEGEPLNWAVAVLFGKTPDIVYGRVVHVLTELEKGMEGIDRMAEAHEPYDYCRNPTKAMEIIFQEGIAIRQIENGTWQAMKSDDLGFDHAPAWNAFHGARQIRFDGTDPLIAAMQCFVASCSEVDWVYVPDELLKDQLTERPRG
jgi:hypothetical protein